MTRTLPSACAFWLLALASGGALAGPIEGNAVFARLVGQWEGEGELVDSSDGTVTPVKETWKGEFTGGGSFSISGKRILDQAEHEFAWEFFANGDLIEGRMKMSEPAIDLRFEAIVSETDGAVTIKVPVDGGGGVLTVVNRVSEDGTKIEGSVELVDDTGLKTNTGKMVHRKR